MSLAAERDLDLADGLDLHGGGAGGTRKRRGVAVSRHAPGCWSNSTRSGRTPCSMARSATTSYLYEGSGHLSQVTQPVGEVDPFPWDERHLLFPATRGYGTAEASTVQLDYGLNGNLAKVTDGRGNATTYLERDLFDRRTNTTNALSHYVQLTWDKSAT